MQSSPAIPDSPASLSIRPELGDDELNALFAVAWPGHRPAPFGPKLARSLLWVAAHRDGRLVGYVNVIGDGGAHAFVLDTTVHPDERRRGLGVRLVKEAGAAARAQGAEWLHVDYEPELDAFYRQCGFRPTAAGLMNLSDPDQA
ncbi:GNAT family N-acetyltransferase [Streptomyces sp. NBC_00239]|uniref:GNAT family N-acetyltransferase n=1 Tax=Streptomyces sp. NBC_00239 TaxID=2903640 RepID=UPI002E2805A0|nr:GNAT family N-acetyltransferase [Streptomyces sp. NBC_00239]